jgi:hypothetical protein
MTTPAAGRTWTIHASGDPILTIAADGQVRGWIVRADGTLAEHNPADLTAARLHMREETNLRRRKSMTRELAREVARVYREAYAAGDPPTVTVAQTFHTSHRTAGRWISQARQMGELGPALGKMAGEASSVNLDF